MERYKLEHYDDAWYLVDTLQQRLLVGPETFAVCDQILGALKGRPVSASDEVSEIEEVADAIRQLA